VLHRLDWAQTDRVMRGGWGELLLPWQQTKAHKHTGGAIVLDAVGYLDQYMAEKPEEFLEYCDWMGIPMQAYPVTLDRFKSLLADQARKLAAV